MEEYEGNKGPVCKKLKKKCLTLKKWPIYTLVEFRKGDIRAVGAAPFSYCKEDFYMKKLIVLLLAFAMVGAVSAQVTTAISLSGAITVIDQDLNAVFADDGAGYDLLTFKATDKDGKYGFSATHKYVLDLTTGLRDWNVWAKGKFTKTILGNLRNADFRMTLPVWYTADFGGTDRITGYGLLIETLPVKNLTFGVNLPFPTAAVPVVDVLQKADVGAKYSDKNFTWVALANLDFVTPANVLNLGFKYTGMKDLTMVLLFKGLFNANDYKVAAGIEYTGLDKLTLDVEGSYQTSAKVYDAWVQAAYAISDVFTASVGGYYASYGYDAYAKLGYDYGNSLSSEASIGYDGAFHAALTLYYAVSF